jgi:hypothetical protein
MRNRKNYLILGIVAVIVILSVTSCASDSECKTCKQVKYENNEKVEEGQAIEYCGAELDKVEGDEVTIGTTTTLYECQSVDQ